MQTEQQSVLQHGIAVKEHMFELINYLETGNISKDWKLPKWIVEYKTQLLNNLLSKDIIEEYTTYHDCGKVYCLSIDKDGKRHFTDHANISYKTWLEAGGNIQAANLMKMDMIIHTMKADDVDEFIKHSEATTLLLAGLSEIHANAKMFGGIDSVSFKIKWKHIDKRGKAICLKLFGEKL